MFRCSTTQTSSFEPWFGLTDAKRARLGRTWAPVFRERIPPLIDEGAFAHFYCPDNGRPNAPVRQVVGVLLLKEWFDLTDEEALGGLEYDMRWHVALSVDPASVHLRQKTLHNFRAQLYADEGASLLFVRVTDALTEALGVTTRTQRLDSTHILSNFARLSRLGLFCETHRVLLRALKRSLSRIQGKVRNQPVARLRPVLLESGDNKSLLGEGANHRGSRVSHCVEEGQRRVGEPVGGQ